MKQNLNIFAIIILINGFLFVSCNKKPAADFKTDKTEYTAGDVVELTNTSTDAKTYKWTFPDGQTSASENVNYTLSSNLQTGYYSFKLEAFSKKGDKSSDATKSITVNAATGQLTVWTSNSNTNAISVKIDDISYGTITMYYGSYPNCGANGCVTADLSVGQHSISATDGNLTWTGTINVNKNICSNFQLL